MGDNKLQMVLNEVRALSVKVSILRGKVDAREKKEELAEPKLKANLDPS